ncbi:hypothetical protein, partial [Streptococcus pneumoniae]|uniref:hypothetical protein n=1 Tax=Streptococcus pneumoniae TaxID=1313 RepID=UPI001E58D9C6
MPGGPWLAAGLADDSAGEAASSSQPAAAAVLASLPADALAALPAALGEPCSAPQLFALAALRGNVRAALPLLADALAEAVPAA